MILSRKLAKLMIEKDISVDDIVHTLSTYNLLGLLPSIRKTVIEMASRTSTNDTMMIESPFILSDDTVLHIKKITGNENIKHEVIINKSILSGFKARFKGILYDGSAERIIRQLTK